LPHLHHTPQRTAHCRTPHCHRTTAARTSHRCTHPHCRTCTARALLRRTVLPLHSPRTHAHAHTCRASARTALLPCLHHTCRACRTRALPLLHTPPFHCAPHCAACTRRRLCTLPRLHCTCALHCLPRTLPLPRTHTTTLTGPLLHTFTFTPLHSSTRLHFTSLHKRWFHTTHTHTHTRFTHTQFTQVLPHTFCPTRLRYTHTTRPAHAPAPHRALPLHRIARCAHTGLRARRVCAALPRGFGSAAGSHFRRTAHTHTHLVYHTRFHTVGYHTQFTPPHTPGFRGYIPTRLPHTHHTHTHTLPLVGLVLLVCWLQYSSHILPLQGHPLPVHTHVLTWAHTPHTLLPLPAPTPFPSHTGLPHTTHLTSLPHTCRHPHWWFLVPSGSHHHAPPLVPHLTLSLPGSPTLHFHTTPALFSSFQFPTYTHTTTQHTYSSGGSHLHLHHAAPRRGSLLAPHRRLPHHLHSEHIFTVAPRCCCDKFHAPHLSRARGAPPASLLHALPPRLCAPFAPHYAILFTRIAHAAHARAARRLLPVTLPLNALLLRAARAAACKTAPLPRILLLCAAHRTRGFWVGCRHLHTLHH